MDLLLSSFLIILFILLSYFYVLDIDKLNAQADANYTFIYFQSLDQQFFLPCLVLLHFSLFLITYKSTRLFLNVADGYTFFSLYLSIFSVLIFKVYSKKRQFQKKSYDLLILVFISKRNDLIQYFDCKLLPNFQLQYLQNQLHSLINHY